ncbi:MAG: ATP-dependent DNA ligase [Candidatus Sungbacteria bacterium]|uniref:Probable DNA ligase n=1 Tax=Candidatus Sungiibacteriota bacterium TaxID=2750080 RepID=A0A933DRR4_9BACT|nr:ATP-dependent DNA ligase [Candidatus Sungbacteria bacterium]
MRFAALAAYLERLEKTTSRNDITRILAELFEKTSAEDIDKACYLLLGELVPAYRGIVFNIAEKTMARIIAKAYARTTAEVLRLYQARGDHGDVAYELAQGRRHAGDALSVTAVYGRLLAIASEAGSGSQERRINSFAALLGGLDPLSAKFVARIPVGKLRLGFSDATVLDALSILTAGDKSARKRIEAAYNVTADIGALARRLRSSGLPALRRLGATPGIPIRPSLAERMNTIDDIIVKAGPEVAVEPKLDGLRTQIHIWHQAGKKEVALFSRNLENTTAMFPEIAAAARRMRVRSAILDGEAIGFNAKTGRYAPFQETAQRKRKHDIEVFAKKIPLVVLVFDALYLNGKSLLNLPYVERRKILERLVGRGADGELRTDLQRVTDDPAVIARELQANVSKGLEGVVVKNLSTPYQAGSRGFHWIKLKATTAALQGLRAGGGPLAGRAGRGKMQLPDTIDCVVMGVYKGRGKRALVGIGGFLIGVREYDRYYSISRLGSGLSDEQFREAAERITELKAAEQPKEYVVLKEIVPDVWIRPRLVVEILADGISLSLRHTAGKKGGGRGYSLRFPRLVRFRGDKNPEDATSVAEIIKMYRGQRS